MERRSFGVAGEKRNRWFQIFHQFSFHRKGREEGSMWEAMWKLNLGNQSDATDAVKYILFTTPGKRNSVSLYIFTQPLKLKVSL